eukprot:1026506-Amphidinium_carterae.1
MSITLYTPRHPGKLSATHVNRLVELGFPVEHWMRLRGWHAIKRGEVLPRRTAAASDLADPGALPQPLQTSQATQPLHISHATTSSMATLDAGSLQPVGAPPSHSEANGILVLQTHVAQPIDARSPGDVPDRPLDNDSDRIRRQDGHGVHASTTCSIQQHKSQHKHHQRMQSHKDEEDVEPWRQLLHWASDLLGSRTLWEPSPDSDFARRVADLAPGWRISKLAINRNPKVHRFFSAVPHTHRASALLGADGTIELFSEDLANVTQPKIRFRKPIVLGLFLVGMAPEQYAPHELQADGSQMRGPGHASGIIPQMRGLDQASGAELAGDHKSFKCAGQ